MATLETPKVCHIAYVILVVPSFWPDLDEHVGLPPLQETLEDAKGKSVSSKQSFMEGMNWNSESPSSSGSSKVTPSTPSTPQPGLQQLFQEWGVVASQPPHASSLISDALQQVASGALQDDLRSIEDVVPAGNAGPKPAVNVRYSESELQRGMHAKDSPCCSFSEVETARTCARRR